MKIADLPPASITLKEARERYEAMHPLDRAVVLVIPLEDVADDGPTEDQLIRMIEHHRVLLERHREMLTA